MDWYYLVLMGVLFVEESCVCIDMFWNKFVVDGLGCKCVVDEFWVIVVEFVELVMVLIWIGYWEEV